MKYLIYFGSVVSVVVIFFFLFASNEKALAYQIASKIIGRAPENGDGAFQIPLGWLILIFAGTILGLLIGYLVENYLVKK